MERTKKVIIGVVLVVLMLVVLFCAFWLSGGKSLFLVYKNYLSQEIPDKQYAWHNFTDRGPNEMLHGYYAGADSNGFYMWTYSGLKRFTHRQGTSIYYYLDTCGMIKLIEEGKGGSKVADGYMRREEMYYDLDTWTTRMQRGDYLWVKRVGEREDNKVIDKVWGDSNNTNPLTAITEQSCE